MFHQHLSVIARQHAKCSRSNLCAQIASSACGLLAMTSIFLGIILFSPKANLAQFTIPEELAVSIDIPTTGYPISLDDVVRLALARSLGIRIARIDYATRQLEVQKAKETFDSELTLSGTYEQDHTQQVSTIQSNRTILGDAKIGLAKTLPLGTTVELALEEERISSAGTFTALSRRYTAQSKVALTQPLLRNFFGYIDRARVQLAQLDVAKFNFATLSTIEEALATALTAYWDMVFAYQDLQSKQAAARRAQEFFRITHENTSLGIAEEPDLLAAEAHLRRQLALLFVSKEEFYIQATRLATLLNIPLASDDPLIPLDVPELRPFRESLEASLERALTARRDLEAARLELESKRIEMHIARQETWPEFELEGSLASGGLDRDHKNALGEAFGDNHAMAFAGVTLTIPLENRGARAAQAQAQLAKEKAAVEFEQLTLSVREEVITTFRRVQAAGERAQQALAVRHLEQAKLTAEETQFRIGRSSSHTLIDFQEDAIRAEADAIRDLAAYEQARLAWKRAEHQLLAELGVITNEPR